MLRNERIYAVDLGFNYLKHAFEVETTDEFGKPKMELETDAVLSVVKRRSEAATDLDSTASEGDLVILDDGTQWNVGQKGSYDLTGDRMNHKEDYPKTYAMLGRYHECTGNREIDRLVTGLPVAEYMQRREQLKDGLQRVHSFGFNKRSVKMGVRNVDVIPQAAGAFYDLALDENGEMDMSKDFLFGRVLVFDIGGRTSDLCAMEHMGYSEEYSDTVYEAMIKLQRELFKLIFKDKRFRYQAKAYELDAALRTGKLRIGGREEDVSDLIQKAIEIRFVEMRNQLTVIIDDFRRFDAIIMCGGGAYHYTPYIEEMAGIPVITIEQPEFANARGYLKYGKMKSQI